MKLSDVKKNLNKRVRYGLSNNYMLTGCMIRKGKDEECFYQAELLDVKHGNSVVICKLEDIAEE